MDFETTHLQGRNTFHEKQKSISKEKQNTYYLISFLLIFLKKVTLSNFSFVRAGRLGQHEAAFPPFLLYANIFQLKTRR